jgi:hypothetical protein
MDKRRTADEAARYLCRQLYEVTDGWSMEWRVVLGGASMHQPWTALSIMDGLWSMRTATYV